MLSLETFTRFTITLSHFPIFFSLTYNKIKKHGGNAANRHRLHTSSVIVCYGKSRGNFYHCQRQTPVRQSTLHYPTLRAVLPFILNLLSVFLLYQVFLKCLDDKNTMDIRSPYYVCFWLIGYGSRSFYVDVVSMQLQPKRLKFDIFNR